VSSLGKNVGLWGCEGNFTQYCGHETGQASVERCSTQVVQVFDTVNGRADNPGITQDAEMMGDAGLWATEAEVAAVCGFAAFGNGPHDRQTQRIGKGLQHGAKLDCVFVGVVRIADCGGHRGLLGLSE